MKKNSSVRPTRESAGSPASSAPRVRYAVVGLGHIAQVAVLPGFAQAGDSELAALVSGDPRKLRALAKKYRVPRTYSYEEFDRCLADPEIDALYIALPNDLHLDCALRGIEAGKHILCEKPLALFARDGRTMAEAAASHGVRLMTAYRLHHEPATLSTLELVRAGRLGDLRYFSSTFSYQLEDANNIRLQDERGGGPLYDIGIYCLNAARMMMEDEPVEVSAFLAKTGDRRFDEVEESAAVLLRFPRGRLATFVVSFGAGDASRYEIVGTKGRVVLEPAFEYSEGLKRVVTIGGKTEEKSFPRTDQFGGEIEAFSRCVLEDREPEPSALEGIADLGVIEAIFASAAEGRAIRLEPWRRDRRPVRQTQEKRKPAVKKPRLVHVTPPHN